MQPNSYNRAMNTQQRPKARWFRIHWQTLIVWLVILSIPCVWVGYSLRWISHRQQAINSGLVEISYKHYLTLRERPATAPCGLWLFGEPGMHNLSVDRSAPIETLQRLFPEAEFYQRPTKQP